MTFSTFCQICAMPCSLVELVPLREERRNEFKIQQYEAEEDELWLKDVLAVSLCNTKIASEIGTVDDGEITFDDGMDPLFVGDGQSDDYYAVHATCFELALGRHWNHVSEITAYKEVARQYHSQYFDFGKLKENQDGWMLKNPLREQRNRERISKWILSTPNAVEAERAPRVPQAPAVRDLLPEEFSTTTLYQWLGLQSNEADEAMIRSAFRRQQRIFHPNVAQGNSDSYARVCTAYKVLTRFRMEYDSCNFSDPSERQAFVRRVWENAVNNSE